MLDLLLFSVKVTPTVNVLFLGIAVTFELHIFTLVTTSTQRKFTPLQLVTTETKGEKGTSFGNFCNRGEKGSDV